MDGRGNRKPGGPIFGLARGDETKVLFYPLVLSFGQAIGLGVEGRGQILLNTQPHGQCLSKVRCEVGVSIRDQLGGKPKPSIHVFEVQVGNPYPRDSRGTG